MGLRRSMRQNAIVSRVAPPLQGSTMAQAMPSKLARARAQASHSHAPRIEQPASVTQPAPPGSRQTTLNQPRFKSSGNLCSLLGHWDNVYSHLSARRSMHSQSSPRMSIRSWLRSHSDY
ncbi:hypothetical protein ACFX13_011883 [Malus domestica]